MSMKWCLSWPYCACGVSQGKALKNDGTRIMIWRNDVGDIKRVPVSELLTFAITEELAADQFSLDCPKTREAS